MKTEIQIVKKSPKTDGSLDFFLFVDQFSLSKEKKLDSAVKSK